MTAAELIISSAKLHYAYAIFGIHQNTPKDA